VPVQLNHTIVWSADRTRSASFVAALLGLPAPVKFGHFDVVQLGNGVTLDFADSEGPIQSQHYAFLVSEAEFDAIFARIREQGLSYWADPMRRSPGKINHGDGGRGVYFADLDDHFMEIITRPYGGGSN
jgi:catechol 2,3-dioxygenase-like lactoylglutathione lyase family enzyme